MRRIGLVVVLALSLFTPLAASAEQAGRKVPRVGVLLQGDPSAPIVLRVTEAFRQGLREYGGYVEGQNVVIEYRSGDLDGLRSAANDLVRLNVNVIAAMGTPAALAAKGATNTTPIVGWAMADPVGDGLAGGLARPGSNVTGNTFLAPELGPKRLQLLREVVPEISHLAVLQHPGVYSERTMGDMLRGLQVAAVGMELRVLEARGPSDFEAAFSAMAKAQAGAVIILPSPMFYVHHRRLVGLAAKHRLPAMYVFREAVESGGLMCYGANIPDLARRAAAYVEKILKGAKPADLPVEQPTKFELVINLKTAKALGLTIPQSILVRADEVIQ